MAIFEWRKFNFFDLREGADSGKILEASKDAEIICGTSGRGQNILCDSLGNIHVFYRNWEYISFKGHDSQIFLCALSTQNNLLITISNEDNGEVPVFKVWNLSKITKDTGAVCIRSVKAALQKPTSLAVTENGQFMAIGFDRGGISLYRGDIGRDRSKNLKTLSSGTSPVTGIAFKQHEKATHMFVCSDSGVLVYNLQNKDKETKIVLDKTYAPTRCCALQTYQGLNEAHFMVGRDDAIYCYTLDGRGPCYALDGQKYIIQWFHSHLLTITKSARSMMPSQKEYTLTVIDIQNKFIVHTSPIDTVVAILIEFGTCVILTKNKECYHLDEKALQSKLNLLFKKNLYDIAIRIAKSQQYDEEGLAGIFKQYGDHLYAKGNYSGAIEQYIKTIGYLEPSYIIRRFLDSRHITFLTDYLQALHKQGQATADITTLLLNCFTRLNLPDKLREFLLEDKNFDHQFDLDVAIKVCRDASIDVALELAKRIQKHTCCISILIEDQEKYEEALDYISGIPVQDAETNLRRYGTILMKHCPDRTTDLLKRLCTNFHSNTTESITIIENTENNDSSNRCNPERIIQLFFKHPEKLMEFLEHLVMHINNCSAVVYNTLIELYLKKWQTDRSVENRLTDLLKTYEDVYDRDHILVQCRMYEFWPGVLWIYEEDKLYHLVVRHYLKTRDYDNLLSSCKRLGPLQPSLWLQALTGLRDDEQAPINLLLQVLNVIASEKLQSPLQVLNCLAVEKGPKFCHVREYFLQVIQKEEEMRKKEVKDVEKLKSDLKNLTEHIENLRSNTIEFRSTICDTCHQPLTLPAVYFMCKHSFHQDCIRTYSENEKDCSVCHVRNAQLIDALHAQNESRDQHEAFHNILERSNDPFSVVAEYFGRGLFNKIVIIDEQDNQEINRNFIEPVQKPISKEKDYGSGAEARLRLNEGRANKSGQLPVNPMPKSEGRLRLEEANKYSLKVKPTSSVRDSIIAAENVSPIAGTSSKISNPTVTKKPAVKTISKEITESKNPFEDEDDGTGDYDESKNPFAEDSEQKDTDGAYGGNPFEEYDNNLNPFA